MHQIRFPPQTPLRELTDSLAGFGERGRERRKGGKGKMGREEVERGKGIERGIGREGTD